MGRRPRPRRNLARRVLVVAEGTHTERQYVERLNGYLRARGATASAKSIGVGADPMRVVRKCVATRDEDARRGKGYDICVCLVDVDEHAKLTEACAYAAKESILLLVTNLKFEVWLRWHAEEKRSVLNSVELDRLAERLGLLANKALAPTFPIHGVEQACTIARSVDPDLAAGRVGPDPSSALPIFVDLLRE